MFTFLTPIQQPTKPFQPHVSTTNYVYSFKSHSLLLSVTLTLVTLEDYGCPVRRFFTPWLSFHLKCGPSGWCPLNAFSYTAASKLVGPEPQYYREKNMSFSYRWFKLGLCTLLITIKNTVGVGSYSYRSCWSYEGSLAVICISVLLMEVSF